MKLITKKIKNNLYDLYETENIEDPVVHLKLFTPWSNWTWYIIEYNEDKELAYGLVDGFEKELGYISMKEIKELRSPEGLKVERDMHWQPKKLSKIIE